MTTLRNHPNIPPELHQNSRAVVAFLQNILDYQSALIPIGGSIKWGSTELPNSNFLFKDGSAVNISDYPDLAVYAEDDAAYTVGASTITLPTDSGFIVRAR